MDEQTKQMFEMRKDNLLAQNDALRAQIQDAESRAISHPDFSAHSNTTADRAADALYRRQNEIIDKIYEIHRQLDG